MNTSRQQASDFSIVEKIKPLAFSVTAGVIVCILLMIAMSVILTVRDVPQAMINPMAIFSISAGGFVSGFICSRICRERGLLMGMLCGIIISLLLFIASFSIADNSFGMLALIKFIFVMLSSMLGGVLGVNVRGRRK